VTATLAPAGHRIRARRVRFDWDATPLHWISGDAQTTHTVNVLHLLLPEGERWFVEVIRQALDRIEDPELADQVKGFIGQESVHSRAHAAVLDHLAEQQVDLTRVLAEIEWLFRGLLADRPLGRRLPRAAQRRWLDLRLAMIAAIEHFTGVLGAWVIDSPGLDAAGADPVMLDLIRWHGAEEVEHRAVAWDLFDHVNGSYLYRALAMAAVAPAITLLWIRGTRELIRRDPSNPPRPSWRALRRAGREGRLPTVGAIARTVPGWFRPGYSPLEIASTADALAYLATSPAATAAAAAASAGTPATTTATEEPPCPD